jgi:hypothetical protein
MVSSNEENGFNRVSRDAGRNRLPSVAAAFRGSTAAKPIQNAARKG